VLLRPADVYVLAGLAVLDEPEWTYRDLAARLRVPHPLVQRALQRAGEADLYSASSRSVHRANFEEFILYGLRFLAPAKLGPVVAGIPAAWAAPPMSRLIHETSDLPPVWPAADGHVRGHELPPLHRSAVEAVATFADLGKLLAVIDSIRAGDVRVRQVASEQARALLRTRPTSRSHL
jgi:hypothetical protein